MRATGPNGSVTPGPEGGTVSRVEGSPERTLVVMRHARAESFALEDRLRSLTSQGRQDAAAAGRWLADRGLTIDAALVSTATRTRETWAALADAAGCSDLEPIYDEALYSAGTDTVLECLRVLPQDARTVLFVGHNPTAGMLVQLLADGGGDEQLQAQLGSGFPPASIAVLRVEGSWESVHFGAATLVDARVVHG